MSVIVNKFERITELLQYNTKTVTSDPTAKTYAATDVGEGFTAGDIILVSGFTNTASNGLKTIVTVTHDLITVSEALGVGETNKSGVKVNQVVYTAWQDVGGCTLLIGTIRTDGACGVYIEWSWDGGTTTEYTSAEQAITGGTGAIINEVAVIAPYARLKVINKDADPTVMSIYFGGRDY